MELLACDGQLNPDSGACSGVWVAVEVPAVVPLSIADQLQMFDLWLPALIVAFGANLIVRKVM